MKIYVNSKFGKNPTCKSQNTKRQATQQSYEQVNDRLGSKLSTKQIFNKYLNEINTRKGKFSHPKREHKERTHMKKCIN
jgi:hypothetical protein